MPRKSKDKSAGTYHEYRKKAWSKQDENVDFGNSTYKDGSPFTEPMLNPKPILFYKDTWHCASNNQARELTGHLAGFPDISFLELSGRWVKVEWDHMGEDHVLPGQKTEARQRYRGR